MHSILLSEEMGVSRESAGGLDSGTNFAEILSNVLPPHSLDKNKEKSSDSSVSYFLETLGYNYFFYIYNL